LLASESGCGYDSDGAATEFRVTLAKQHRLRIGRYSEIGRPYLVTAACHDRQAVFAALLAGRCFAFAVAAMEHDAKTWCWVAMPDHVHWLMAPQSDLVLSRCVQKMKALTTRCLRKHGLWAGTVWQRGFHDRALRRNEDLQAVARYVIANPVRAGLVKSVRDWSCWDATWI